MKGTARLRSIIRGYLQSGAFDFVDFVVLERDQDEALTRLLTRLLDEERAAEQVARLPGVPIEAPTVRVVSWRDPLPSCPRGAAAVPERPRVVGYVMSRPAQPAPDAGGLLEGVAKLGGALIVVALAVVAAPGLLGGIVIAFALRSLRLRWSFGVLIALVLALPFALDPGTAAETQDGTQKRGHPVSSARTS